MGSISTSGNRGRLTDVVLPVQKYLPGSVTLCGNDANLASFSLLSASFGRTAFSSSYDPWETVDVFGRSKIYKSLLCSFRSVMFGPRGSSVRRIDAGEDSSVVEESALRVPSGSKQRRMERRSASQSRASSVVQESPHCSSKD